MNLWFRLLLMTWRALRAPRLDPMSTSTLRMRVLPHDLDVNLHMNNGRYLTVMDLGRIDLVIRVGLFRALWRHRWQPVVAGLTMRFRRPLAPFQAYELRTRLVAWDDHWFYLEQIFVSRGEVAATGYLKTTFVGRGGKVPSQEIATAGGLAARSPDLPEWVNVFSV